MENQIDVEHLLRSKSWDQLNEQERSVSTELFSGEGEYTHVRNLMHELRSESGIQEEEMKPSAYVRENLLAAFEDEQRRRRVLWWNSLGFWLRDQLRFDIPAVRIAVAGLIVTLGIVAVTKLSDNNNDAVIVNNDKSQPAPKVVLPGQEDKLAGTPEQNSVEPETLRAVPDEIEDEAIVEQTNHNTLNPDQNIVQKGFADTSASNGLVVGPTIGEDSASSLVSSFTNATICCGANNAAITATGATSTYSWTTNDGTTSPSTMNANVVGIYDVTYIPSSRSLAKDEEVIGAMFSLR